MRNLNTTIVAISTPPGKGGVAVIRLSGEDAFAIADRVFLPRFGTTPFSERRARESVFGDVLYDGEKIDDGLAVRFVAPHSFTGEDTVEISCHGGVLVTRSVLEAFLSAGAVLADRGEFTRRAFINGKITLTDAEAIGDLLEAKSLTAVRLASGTSRDKLTRALDDIRYDLISLMSSIYARIDYPDEDLGEFTDNESLTILEGVRAKVEKLLSTYKTGRAIREGVRTVIVGKPNVGKSSLYNAILGEDYAIVTDIEGTTRDVLEHTAPFGKVTLSLLDTAGLRPTDDPVEKIGVSRSKERMEEAELLLAHAGEGLEVGEETDKVYYVQGTIKSIASATFGNMTIEDEDGNTLYIYGTWDKSGSTRYDKMTDKPQVGDKVILVGAIKNYNGTIEMMNGRFYSVE